MPNIIGSELIVKDNLACCKGYLSCKRKAIKFVQVGYLDIHEASLAIRDMRVYLNRIHDLLGFNQEGHLSIDVIEIMNDIETIRSKCGPDWNTFYDEFRKQFLELYI